MKKQLEDSKIIYETKSSTGRLLKASEVLEVIHLSIKGNSSITKHTLEFPIDFFVISGKGIINISGKSIEVNENDLISVEPNIERAWTNNDSSPLNIIGIKNKF